MATAILMDLGNSRLNIALVSIEASRRFKKVRTKFVAGASCELAEVGHSLNRADKFRDFFREQLDHLPEGASFPDFAILASVNPPWNKPVEEGWQAWLGGLNLADKRRPEIIIPTAAEIRPYIGFDYGQPEGVGLDRLLSFIAVRQELERNFLIIDAGTATTFSVGNESGYFAGGAIAPGPQMLARAMAEYTSALPLVDLEDISQGGRWKGKTGQDTVSSLQIGAREGYRQMIRGLARKIIRRYQKKTGSDLKVVLTGGNSRLLLKLLKKKMEVTWDKNLIYRGMGWLAPRLAPAYFLEDSQTSKTSRKD